MSDSFSNLVGTHTDALEENSIAIASLLEAINEKVNSGEELFSETDQKTLKSIKRTLNKMNKQIDKM